MNVFEIFQLNILMSAVIAILIVYILIKVRFENREFAQLAKILPGPHPLPLIGNLLNVAGLLSSSNPIAELKQWNEKYGSIYCLQGTGQLVIIVGGVDNFQILSNSMEMMGRHFHETFVYFGEEGLFSASVSAWKADRKLLQPVFGKNALKNNIPKMNAVITKFVQRLRKFENGPEFDVIQYCLNFVMNIFSQTQFDYEVDDEIMNKIDIRKDARSLIRTVVIQEALPFLKTTYIDNVMRRLFVQPIKNKYNDLIKTMLRHKITQLKRQASEREIDESELASTLFASNLKNGMIDEDWMVNHIRSFIAAGTDTLAQTISFCLLMIAMYPNIQKKLYDEIQSILGEDDRLPTSDDLEYFVYLNQVLKETQRRWTLTPLVIRVADEDFKIGSHLLPTGTRVLLDLTSVHFDHHFYPDPFEFNPDNFSPEAIAQRSKFSFLPFGIGPRICIGKEYTEYVFKLTMIALLRTYSFHTTMNMENFSTNFLLIIFSKTGYPLSIKPRK